MLRYLRPRVLSFNGRVQKHPSYVAKDNAESGSQRSENDEPYKGESRTESPPERMI